MTAINWPLRGATQTAPRATTDQPSRVGSWAILVVLAVFVLLLALAGFRSVLVSEQFGLDRLNARLENAQEQSQVLRMEVARLENPDRILAVAQGRLGMVPPPARVYLAAVVPGDLLHPVPAPSYNPFSRTSR
ncbi:MAG TPA: hypothetical protein EYG34_00030 [Acidimicrobiia bacterium]|nr:hypothetical protein [Acidimicrobiia bacterium]HIL45494.1 hypothetical protein [Acidimicrobiia bacterium]